MKELSIEEKAKAYDKAIERANELYDEHERDIALLIFPELKESEDEKIRKAILSYLALYKDAIGEEYESWIAWLEKQAEHANFRNKIQIGDKVTRNKDGVLVNLSQLKRVAKKQDEQKPAWSEEDEKLFRCAIDAVREESKVRTDGCLDEEVGEMVIDWLKSLKDRYTWKPSDEQIEALLKLEEMHVLEHEKNQENAHLYMVVKSIREQLLKLREE